MGRAWRLAQTSAVGVGAAALLAGGFVWAGEVALRLETAAWLLALSLGAAWVAWRATRPHTQTCNLLVDALEGLAQHERAPRAMHVPDLDEKGDLAVALDGLRERITTAFERVRQLRMEVEEADRYKTAFLDSVSHELRTPLNAILGFAQVLMQELDGPLTPGQRENVRVIHASGEYLLSLFNDILDLSVMASGRMTLRREPVDLAELMRQTAAMLEGQRRGRAVDIHTVIAPGLQPVDGEPTRIRQILVNLAANALKFTERGWVRLEAQAVPEGVRLSVQDTGIGIAREELDHIFDEFIQVGESSDRPTGSGLGLAICKHLVELHGGSIRVDSALGRGTCFDVLLPAWRGPSGSGVPRSSAAASREEALR